MMMKKWKSSSSGAAGCLRKSKTHTAGRAAALSNFTSGDTKIGVSFASISQTKLQCNHGKIAIRKRTSSRSNC